MLLRLQGDSWEPRVGPTTRTACLLEHCETRPRQVVDAKIGDGFEQVERFSWHAYQLCPLHRPHVMDGQLVYPSEEPDEPASPPSTVLDRSA